MLFVSLPHFHHNCVFLSSPSLSTSDCRSLLHQRRLQFSKYSSHWNLFHHSLVSLPYTMNLSHHHEQQHHEKSSSKSRSIGTTKHVAHQPKNFFIFYRHQKLGPAVVSKTKNVPLALRNACKNDYCLRVLDLGTSRNQNHAEEI